MEGLGGIIIVKFREYSQLTIIRANGGDGSHG
jgi:hypothetical protein